MGKSVLLVAAVVVSACTTVEIKEPERRLSTVVTVKAPKAQLKQNATFRWCTQRAGIGHAKDVPGEHRMALDRHARESMAAYLKGKGYQLQSVGPATYLIGYRIIVQDGIDDEALDEFHGANSTWQGRGKSRGKTYRRGMMVIDFMSARNRRLLWRGSIQAEIEKTKKLEVRKARVDYAIRRLLDGAPF